MRIQNSSIVMLAKRESNNFFQCSSTGNPERKPKTTCIVRTRQTTSCLRTICTMKQVLSEGFELKTKARTKLKSNEEPPTTIKSFKSSSDSGWISRPGSKARIQKSWPRPQGPGTCQRASTAMRRLDAIIGPRWQRLAAGRGPSPRKWLKRVVQHSWYNSI